MTYQNRNEFTAASSSEKTTLVFIYPAQKLVSFTANGVNKWKKSVSYIVDKVKKGNVYLTQSVDEASLNSTNQFYFDILTNTLHIYSTSANPNLDEIIVFYKLCFADTPLKLSHNLNTGEIVEFEARVQSNPGYKSILSTENISIVSGGTLSLENNDGFFNDKYNRLVWDDKLVEIYSYNRQLDITEAKLVFRGFIENKTYNATDFNLSVKDIQNALNENIELIAYVEADKVDPKYYSTYKRQVYGDTKGLDTRTVDLVNSEYHLNEEYFGGNLNENFPYRPFCPVYGEPVKLYSKMHPVSSVKIGDTEYYRDINGAYLSPAGVNLPAGTHLITTHFTNTTTNQYCYAPGEILIKYDKEKTPYFDTLNTVYHNRYWQVAGHALSSQTVNIVGQISLNTFVVDDPSNFDVGNRILIRGYYYYIASIRGSKITTTTASQTGINIGYTCSKQAISNVYIDGKQVAHEQILGEVFDGTNTFIKVSNLAELSISTMTKSDQPFIFRNKQAIPAYGWKVPTYIEIQKTDAADAYFTVGSIISVYGQPQLGHLLITGVEDHLHGANWHIHVSLDCFDKFAQYTPALSWLNSLTIDTSYYWSKINEITYLQNDSSLVVDCSGKTLDGTKDGEVIRTGPQIIKDLVQNISPLNQYFNLTSLDTASLQAPFEVSLAVPFDINDKKVPKIKDVINLINKSIKASVYIDNNFQLAYKVLNVVRETNQLIINDADVISWSITSKSNDLYSNAEVKYDFRDYNNDKKQKDSLSHSKVSAFTEKYETSIKTIDIDIYIRNLDQVKEITERVLFGKTLNESIVKINGAFSLIDIEIGQQVILDLKDLYKDNYGEQRFVGMITSITRNGNSINFEVSDLGNLYEMVGVIAPDTAVSFAADSLTIKADSSYITEIDGIVNNDEQTTNKNLIG